MCKHVILKTKIVIKDTILFMYSAYSAYVFGYQKHNVYALV